MIEGDAVLSEVLAAPGATDSVFDLLAAAVSVLAAGPRLALLGFGGGGMIAPLRALGWQGEVDAVDLDVRGESLFRDLSSDWCGTVRFQRDDASRWLQRRRGAFHAIVDDLSELRCGETTKPAASYEGLPEIVGRRLAAGGVAIINSLPVPGLTWEELTRRVTAGQASVREVSFEAFENRVLLAGAELPQARPLGSLLRGALGRIGSALRGGIGVRSADP
jgi:hypothetical protein